MSEHAFQFLSHCCGAKTFGEQCGSCKEHCSYAQPEWICSTCGNKYGNKPCDVATFHNDTCGICAEYTSVTEPRDFGFINFDLL